MNRIPMFMRMIAASLAAVSIALPIAAPVASAASPTQLQPPPPARTVNVVDHEFGLTLPDPYRWMEGANNAEFDAWLKAQGEYTRAKLDELPTLAAWRQRMQQASGATILNVRFQRAGGKLFYGQITAHGRTLMVRNADGTQHLLLDATTLPGIMNGAEIQSFSPSPDGRLVAVDIGLGAGQEVSQIKILDTETMRWRPDTIEPVWGEFFANWLPDGRGFAYTQMAPEKEHPKGDPMQNMRTRLHMLGTPVANDPVLLRAGQGEGSNASFKLANDEFPIIVFPTGSNWAVASAGSARPESRLCVAPRAAAMKPGAAWRCIAEYDDDVQAPYGDTSFGMRGDTLYLLSVHDAPNGRVLALDLSKPDATLKDARVVLPMADDAVVTDLAAARDALYVKRMRKGIDELLRVDYVSGKTEPIAMPFAGSVDISADTSDDGVVFKVQGWTAPGVAYEWVPKNGALRELGLRDTVPGDYSMLASTETEAVSADGTRVPLSIIHRKDIKLDGRHRALVEGYGGYGVSLQPGFAPNRLQWVKAGEVYAVCHVRGGGEKGDAWHRAGQGADKHKGVEDFVACAGELARRGYTTPERTGLEAASMGGVLIGGAVTAFPDKFGAALVDVGILNPVRLLAAENGANQIGELGDPRTEAGLKAIAAMDPYQHVKPGTKYPAVLFQVGLKDSRVPPWMTGKFAARLRAASTSGKPIWIRTDAAGGHFAFSLGGVAAQLADEYAFLDAELPGP